MEENVTPPTRTWGHITRHKSLNFQQFSIPAFYQDPKIAVHKRNFIFEKLASSRRKKSNELIKSCCSKMLTRQIPMGNQWFLYLFFIFYFSFIHIYFRIFGKCLKTEHFHVGSGTYSGWMQIFKINLVWNNEYLFANSLFLSYNCEKILFWMLGGHEKCSNFRK